MTSERNVRCDGRCDEMGCRGHGVLSFKDCPERVEDRDDFLAALFESLEDAINATATAERERDAAKARVAELEDSIRLRRADDDIARSYGRNTEAGQIAEAIRARRGEDWQIDLPEDV